MHDPTTHWQTVYGTKATTEVSWYRPHLELSLGFIERAGLSRDAAILDVGAGASTLVDDLLDRGFTNVSLLDVSEKALEVTRTRLGERGALVKWLVGDVTTLELPRHSIDFWHDRAVFHFLTDPAARRRYVALVQHALKPGGHVLVATFAPDGPEKCSGLEVCRYSAEGIHEQFGGDFHQVDSAREVHVTPRGGEQAFAYCYCRLPG